MNTEEIILWIVIGLEVICWGFIIFAPAEPFDRAMFDELDQR